MLVKALKGRATAVLVGALATAMVVPQLAFASGVSNLLTNIGNTIVIPLLALIAIIILVVKIKDYVTGQGSIGQIVVPVLVCLLVIGLVTVFINIDALSATFGTISSSAVDAAAEVATDALG